MQNGVLMKFKGILETEMDTVIRKARANAATFAGAKDRLSDEADMATADLEQGMNMRMGNRESLYLKKVMQALERIKDGSYGECHSCGGDISERRLEARPTAELCIACKEETERSENLSVEGRKPKSVGRALSFRN